MTNAVELPVYVALTSYACAFIAVVFVYLSNKSHMPSMLLWLSLFGALSIISITLPGTVDLSVAIVVAFLLPLVVLAVVLTGKWPTLTAEQDDSFVHYFHLWRLPASFVPLWLYQSGVVPIQMTFEGYNFDIIAGLTAPVLSSLAFGQQMLNKTVVMVWNILAAIILLASTWVVYSELMTNSQLMALYASVPFSLLLLALAPLSLAFHVQAVWRVLQGKMKLTD